MYLGEDGSFEEIFSGGSFAEKELTRIINLEGQEMSDRDSEWLESHNTRRKDWHERYNKPYVPLKWSEGLRAESKVWAEHLLSRCGKGMLHDPDNQYGENLAGNSGTGSWVSNKQSRADGTIWLAVSVDECITCCALIFDRQL